MLFAAIHNHYYYSNGIIYEKENFRVCFMNLLMCFAIGGG